MIGVLSVSSPLRTTSLLASSPSAGAGTVTATGTTSTLTTLVREALSPAATGVDLRAPAPAPIVVRAPLSSGVSVAPSPSMVAAPPAPLNVPTSTLPALGPTPTAQAAPVPMLAPADPPAGLPPLPAMLFSSGDASAVRPPALATVPALPVVEAELMPPATRERSSGGAAVTPAGAVGVRVDAPDWALYGAAAVALGGVGWWLFKRRR